MSLNASSRHISDLIIEALLGNLKNAPDYTELAKRTASMGASTIDAVYKEVLDGRTLLEPRRPLRAYVGRYFNAMRNFFIDVSHHNGDLYLSFMGREKDTFKLASYGDNSFFFVSNPK